MILTVTLNPSVDISYPVGSLALDTVNRVAGVSKTAGGKGLNVSRVLHQLGEEVRASGFLGGSLGDFIRGEIGASAINDGFTAISGQTRNCIAIIHDGQQTEILENGPEISAAEQADFLKAFKQQALEATHITISGSMPPGVSENFYNKLLEIAAEMKTPVLLDVNGKLLQETLSARSAKPFLIKPNESELAALIGQADLTDTEIIHVLKTEAIFSGIEMVIVTQGKDGALAKIGKEYYRIIPPEITAVNPVGSGDSVIAGFAAGLSKGLTATALLKYALSMGVLNAMEKQTGYVDTEKIDDCVAQMSVEHLNEGDGINE
ncbi:hexose kinase [Virgibacillus halophilus]|uniref:hexose kinase n=1 Tax=Tigheibacillus halophilus TaxID=361280 RepID=UPI00362CC573